MFLLSKVFFEAKCASAQAPGSLLLLYSRIASLIHALSKYQAGPLLVRGLGGLYPLGNWGLEFRTKNKSMEPMVIMFAYSF